MGKYFGTDGFRGEANANLTADHAYKVGRFLGWYYGELRRRKGEEGPARIVIGKDTTAQQVICSSIQPGRRTGGFRVRTPTCST